MNESNWKTVRSSLDKVSQRDLVGLIKEFYELSPQNKLFLDTRFSNPEAGLEKYKLIIEKNICPIEPWKKDVSLSTGRKAISDYKKARGEPEGLLELMIYYCECGVNFTLEFGDIDERFYGSIESMFENVFKFLKTNPQYIDQFLPRLKQIVNSTKGIGWGFHDFLADTFRKHCKDLP